MMQRLAKGYITPAFGILSKSKIQPAIEHDLLNPDLPMTPLRPRFDFMSNERLATRLLLAYQLRREHSKYKKNKKILRRYGRKVNYFPSKNE